MKRSEIYLKAAEIVESEDRGLVFCDHDPEFDDSKHIYCCWAIKAAAYGLLDGNTKFVFNLSEFPEFESLKPKTADISGIWFKGSNPMELKQKRIETLMAAHEIAKSNGE